MTPIPCKGCVTYAVCRSYLIDCLPKDFKNNSRTYQILSLALLRGLEPKCCLIRDHIDYNINLIELDFIYSETDGIDLIYYDEEVAKMLIEAFDLENYNE